MHNIVHNVGIASQIGSYSDAIEVPPGARWLLTSGTPGLALDGGLPADIRARPNSPGATLSTRSNRRE